MTEKWRTVENHSYKVHDQASLIIIFFSRRFSIMGEHRLSYVLIALWKLQYTCSCHTPLLSCLDGFDLPHHGNGEGGEAFMPLIVPHRARMRAIDSTLVLY